MSHHTAIVAWERGGDVFTDNHYSRAHLWRFDGGAEVAASSSPANVRMPFSVAANVDPEEGFVAVISSCHMLWFLGLAAAAGYCVDSYRDAADGVAAKNAAGHDWMAQVTLRPDIVFSGGKLPDDEAVAALHHRAHQACHIANSVTTGIVIAGAWRAA